MLKITKEDYTEMEVKTMNGEWVKKDVLMTLVSGGAIYLEGQKGGGGTYTMGMVVPATAYKEIPKKEIVRKPLKECILLLVDHDYLPNDMGDYVKPSTDTSDIDVIDADDLVMGILEYLPEWLKEEKLATPVKKEIDMAVNLDTEVTKDNPWIYL